VEAASIAQVAHQVPSVGPFALSAIGIFVVFSALTTLVLVLMVFSKLLANVPDPGHGAKPAARVKKPKPNKAGATATGKSQEDTLLAVALAAYGMHLGRRISVRSPQPSSSWLHSARAVQVHRFPTKR
jgi:Na+-transporting methylmalonyl-CoA/oxaloacetate decarboxylase gamma subunit